MFLFLYFQKPRIVRSLLRLLKKMQNLHMFQSICNPFGLFFNEVIKGCLGMTSGAFERQDHKGTSGGSGGI